MKEDLKKTEKSSVLTLAKKIYEDLKFEYKLYSANPHKYKPKRIIHKVKKNLLSLYEKIPQENEKDKKIKKIILEKTNELDRISENQKKSKVGLAKTEIFKVYIKALLIVTQVITYLKKKSPS